MPLTLHHSAHVTDLVLALAENLRATWPEDPFEPVGIIVGHGAMRKWLQHALATEIGVACRFTYPLLRPGLDAALARVQGAPQRKDGGCWEVEDDPAEGSEALTYRVVAALRRRHGGRTGSAENGAFEAASRYLGRGTAGAPEAQKTAGGPEAQKTTGAPEDAPIGRREWVFARQVAGVLDDLRRERGPTAEAWAKHPESAGAHRWLAELLAETAVAGRPTSEPPPKALAPLHLFGTSSLSAGDRARVRDIAQKADVHLYLALPADRGEHAPLGAHAADLRAWASACGARTRPALVTPAPSAGEGQSIAFFSAWGPARQVEVLRDQLLTLFALNPSLEPRDVQVLTPDVEMFAPLVQTIFAQRPGRVARALDTSSADAPNDADTWDAEMSDGDTSDGDTSDSDTSDSDVSGVDTSRLPGGKWRHPAASRAPAIPVAIGDLGLSRTNAVASVLLTVLDLVGERITAPALFDLLSLDPVRSRFGIEAEELEDVQELLAQSRMRWADDAADRAGFDQPTLDQNTLRFGLERLAIGVLLPDGGGLTVIAGAPGPVAAQDVEGRDRASLVGKVAHFMATLRDWRKALADPGLPIEEWGSELADLLDDLTATSAAAAWLRVEVDATLRDAWVGIGAVGGVRVRAQGIRAMLAGKFEQTQRGDKVHGGAVTFSGMQSMRSAPFRVTALLGMEDGSFPRNVRRPQWDPMATPAPGELDRRVIDRHLLLETLLCTRDHMLVFFTGRDVKSGQPMPAAVPVEEWIDAVRAAEGKDRPQVVHETPLQPWSPAAFEGAGKTFDPQVAAACLALQQAQLNGARPIGLAARGGAELAEEDSPVTTLDLDDLAEGLARPLKMLLKRLDVTEAWELPVLEDREPVSLGTLQEWGLRDRELKALIADPSLADAGLEVWLLGFTARLRAEGVLPLEAGAEAIIERVHRAATDIAGRWGQFRNAAPTVSLEIEGVMLSGRAQGMATVGEDRCLGWVTASKPEKPVDLLNAYLHLLANAAAGAPIRWARVVGYGGDMDLEVTLDAVTARARLTALVQLWRLARRRPLPLFEKTSYALAVFMDGEGFVPAPSDAAVDVDAAWAGRFGDVTDPAVQAFFEEFDPVGAIDSGPVEKHDPRAFTALAAKVWQPVVAAAGAGVVG